MQAVRPDFVQSTHCCGNLWLHPYGAEQLGHAPDYEMFTNVCQNVFPDLTVGVDRIRCGETWSTIYPASGTTLDEGYAQTGASSWSYEMSGRGAIAPWGQPIVDTDVRVQETESWRGVMHGLLHAEKYGALPRITAVSGDADALTVTVTNEGWGNVTQAHLRFAGHAVSLPGLTPGQSVAIRLPGPWRAGDVPAEVEWKKRMHPDSNWGRTFLDIELTAEGASLAGVLPVRLAAPSMGALLPEPTDSFRDVPSLALAVDGAQDGAGQAAPMLPLAALIGVALAAAAWRRRA